ncbi:MAG: Calx-beta domain-containing protein [Actinomycetota bacterium]
MGVRDYRRWFGGAWVLTLILTLVPSAAHANPFFASTAATTIPDSGAASPYPSEIAVSGLSGPVTDVNVRLVGLTHTNPDDLDLLLVAPGGQSVVILSDAGGTDDVSDLGLIFDDEGSTDTSSDNGPLVFGRFFPTDWESGDVWPVPAPSPTQSSPSFSVFDGTDPNGTWSLYVNDDQGAGSGTLSEWRVEILTSGSIDIPATGPASPYPSTRTVSGLAGPVTDVNVVLSTFSHTFPDDVDMLLVGPGGQNAIVMSDVGGGNDAAAVTLTLDDEAAIPLPDTGGVPPGTFMPANYGSGDPFPAPAPTPAGGSALSVFDGTDPNGSWGLYVNDPTVGDYGGLSGWDLQITTQPPAPGGSSPAVSSVKVRVTEGKRAVIPLTLSGPPGQPVTFGFSTQNGSAKAGKDYRELTGTITFAAGETSRSVSVKTLNDRKDERKEKFSVRITDQSGGTVATATAVIRDND